MISLHIYSFRVDSWLYTQMSRNTVNLPMEFLVNTLFLFYKKKNALLHIAVLYFLIGTFSLYILKEVLRKVLIYTMYGKFTVFNKYVVSSVLFCRSF